MTSDFMNKINNNTVTVSTSDELKEALEQNNGYEYIYLENDITLNSGITINSKKSKVTINGTYQNIMHTLTGMNSSEATDTIISTALTKEVQMKNMKIINPNIYGTIYVSIDDSYDEIVTSYDNVILMEHNYHLILTVLLKLTIAILLLKVQMG